MKIVVTRNVAPGKAGFYCWLCRSDEGPETDTPEGIKKMCAQYGCEEEDGIVIMKIPEAEPLVRLIRALESFNEGEGLDTNIADLIRRILDAVQRSAGAGFTLVHEQYGES